MSQAGSLVPTLDRDIIGPDTATCDRRRSVSGPGLRTFTAIADLWGLKKAERRRILGHQSKTSFVTWMAKARQHKELTLDFDVLTRISLVLGIYSALRCLYISEAAGLEWLRRQNNVPAFGGQPPMTLVTSGSLDALFEVRQFLDGARGGLFIAPNEADIDFSPYTDANIFWS